MSRDYYRVLGVSERASLVEIKQAYRRLAKKYHPDVSQEADSEYHFKLVNEAYDVLGNEIRRTRYDREVRQKRNHNVNFNTQQTANGRQASRFGSVGTTGRGGINSQHSPNVSNAKKRKQVWGSIFGKKPKDQHVKIRLDLEDALGTPKKRVRLPDGQQLYVKIPEGITEGTKIRVSGKGVSGGDLYLTIGFNSHEHFRAEGKDIHANLNITPWEAALGATLLVPTLKGSVPLKLPEGTQAGTRLRMAGHGLPGSRPGDQYISVHIHTPPISSESERVVYEQMQNVFGEWSPRTHF
jgi:curved DNA-binding protein